MSFWKPGKQAKPKDPTPVQPGKAVRSRKKYNRSNPISFEAKILAIQDQRQKSQAALQRYYSAFEAGSMAPATCNGRVAELTAQISQLDAKILDLDREREKLDLPALRMEFIREILTNLQGIVDAVPKAQKKAPSPLTREEGAQLRPAYV